MTEKQGRARRLPTDGVQGSQLKLGNWGQHTKKIVSSSCNLLLSYSRVSVLPESWYHKLFHSSCKRGFPIAVVGISVVNAYLSLCAYSWWPNMNRWEWKLEEMRGSRYGTAGGFACLMSSYPVQLPPKSGSLEFFLPQSVVSHLRETPTTKNTNWANCGY